MSRKSVFLAIGILVLLGAGAATALIGLLRHEPTFYRQGAQPPGAARKRYAGEFLTQVGLLNSALRESREWSGELSEAQINSFFAEGLQGPGGEDKILPDDMSDPRVRIEADRVRLGFRYGSGFWSTIVSIDLRAWVAPGEPNVVALELQGMHAGAMPISAQSLLEHVSEAARRRNVEVTWYRHEGNPVALLRFQGRRSRTTVQLQQLELQPGKLWVHGRSVDPAPVRVAPPAEQ